MSHTARLRSMHELEVTLPPAEGPLPNFNPGLFAYKGQKPNPDITEYTYAYGEPQEWTDRILNGTIVHTSGNTSMAVITHHTVERPKCPPGSIKTGTFTLSKYDIGEDPAMEELAAVAAGVRPFLPALIAACRGYHRHTEEAWITTAGFMTAARNAGLQLSRAEYLALERSVQKDTLGRINYLQVEELVLRLAPDA